MVDRLLEKALPPLPDQADNLVLWFGERYRPGVYVDILPQPYRAVAGADSDEGLRLIVQYLLKKEHPLLDGDERREAGYIARVRLSFDGWQRFSELTRGAVKSNRAFMAMKFGDATLNDIVDQHFRAAVLQTGFELFRLDDDPQAGLIDDRMRVEIRRARILIADLTHGNAGAYWEAGFAEGLGKRVIYTCEQSVFCSQDPKVRPHFDTSHCHTVCWDATNPEKAAEDLKNSIRATLPEAALFEDAVEQKSPSASPRSA